jgi:hypothetical protein
MDDHLFEQRTVALAELVEAALELLLIADENIPRWLRIGLSVLVIGRRHGGTPLHHMVRHGRHQRERQDERGEHRDDDRLRHGLEQVTGDAAKLEKRVPDDRDAEGGDERREDDLLGGIDDGLLKRLVHGEMAINILDYHSRIVD